MEEGGYQIDPAELFRVWPAAKSNATPERDNATDKKLGHATKKIQILQCVIVLS